MIAGIIGESYAGERRVAIIPATVPALAKLGMELLVEPGAGAAAGFPDEEYRAKGAAVLGVSFDTVAENAAFAEKFSFPFPLLCDTGRDLGMSYGACDAPGARHAARITSVIGPDLKIREAIGQVDVKQQPTDLLTRL